MAVSKDTERAGIRLLLADNSGAFLDLLAQALRAAGFLQIQRATSSEGFLSLVQRRRPTLALVDLALAPRPATELLATLRRAHPGWLDIPVIGMASRIRRGELEEARKAGIGLVLTKPVRASVLVRRIDEMVGAVPKPVAPDGGFVEL